jgi:hypothetical protein
MSCRRHAPERYRLGGGRALVEMPIGVLYAKLLDRRVKVKVGWTEEWG